MGARSTSKKRASRRNRRKSPEPIFNQEAPQPRKTLDWRIWEPNRTLLSIFPEQTPPQPKFENLSPEAGKVTRTFKGEASELFHLEFKSLETGNIFELKVTPEHTVVQVPNSNSFVTY